MKVELFKPENEELQKYIESFYILTHSKDEEKTSYLTFPTLFSVVALVLNAENIVTPENITTKYCATKPLETSLVCRFNKPICFQYEGDIKEVCIYFKPLGLNAFLEQPLETYSSSSFDKFVPFSDYESSMIPIYAIDYATPFPFGEAMNDIEKNGQVELKAEIENAISKFTEDFDRKIESGHSLTELTYFMNTSELRGFLNKLHNELMLLAGGPDDFFGPLLTAEWFKRNLYMWSLIQKKVEQSDRRIMVLVGASHAAMMELFIKENNNWKVTELQEVMGK